MRGNYDPRSTLKFPPKIGEGRRPSPVAPRQPPDSPNTCIKTPSPLRLSLASGLPASFSSLTSKDGGRRRFITSRAEVFLRTFPGDPATTLRSAPDNIMVIRGMTDNCVRSYLCSLLRCLNTQSLAAQEQALGARSIVCSSLRSSTGFNRLGSGSELPLRSPQSPVRERGVEPPRPYRALAPEASASAIPPLARYCTAPRDYHDGDCAPKSPNQQPSAKAVSMKPPKPSYCPDAWLELEGSCNY